MNIITTIVSFLLFAALLAFMLYFGVVLILVAVISFGLLWLYIVLRGYWASFQRRNNPLKPNEGGRPEGGIHGIHKTTTIIDAEYHEIPDKKQP